MNKNILAGLLCCSLIPCPGIGRAQARTSKAVTSFTWIYNAEPEPGKRTWSLQPDGTWHERYPKGNLAKVFHMTRRGAVEGCAGAIVGSRQDQGLEIFIPDVGCRRMVAKFRRGAGPWNNMGNMKSIGTAAVVAKPDSPPKTSIPDIVNQPTVPVGGVPSEWVGKWLLLRGEFCAWTGKPDDDNPACGNWDWIIALENDSIRITGEFPLGGSPIKMNGEKCTLDAKASPRQGRSDEDSAVQYSCKLENGTISLSLIAVKKERSEVILPSLNMDKDSYALRTRLMEGGRCQYVALEKRSHSVVNFEGETEHRSHNYDSGGSLKRNISCKVFGNERAARKAYKGRAEFKLKHEPKSSGNPEEELGD